MQHHVFSFSEAKTFEVRIYKEEIARRIIFDKAGLAALGCNIHDWMLGSVYIANSALFTQTDENGEASFTNIPKREYTVKVWHPIINDKDIEQIHVATSSAKNVDTKSLDIVLLHPILPSYHEFDDVHSLQHYD